MQLLTAAKARAGFTRVTRAVIKSRKPVLVSTPAGLVQISAYDIPEEIPPAPRGSLKRTEQEIELGNTLGETL